MRPSMAALVLVGCASSSLPPIESAGAIQPEVTASVEVPRGSAEGSRVTLAEVVSEAADRAPQVVMAEARLAVEAARADAETGSLLPTARAGFGLRDLRGRAIGNFGTQMDDREFTSFDPRVSLFYRINLGERIGASMAAQHRRDALEHEGQDARRRAMLSAARAYLDLVLADAALGISGALVDDAERFVRLARAREASEVASAADVARGEASLARARQARSRARGQREAVSARLAVLLGRDPDARLDPREGPIEAWSLIEAGAEGSERPDVRAARARSAAASSQATAAWLTTFGPELDTGLSAGLTGLDLGDLSGVFQAWLWVGLTFSFDQLGRARVADAEAHLADLAVADAEMLAGAEAVAARAVLRAEAEAVPEARVALEASQRSHRIQLARFEAGTGDGFELLVAQDQLARARLEMVRTLLRYDASQVELLAALGRLEPSSLPD